jgi:hypothetical protein
MQTLTSAPVVNTIAYAVPNVIVTGGVGKNWTHAGVEVTVAVAVASAGRAGFPELVFSIDAVTVAVPLPFQLIHRSTSVSVPDLSAVKVWASGLSRLPAEQVGWESVDGLD